MTQHRVQPDLHDEELLAIPWVELYRVHYVGGYRSMENSGPLFLTRLPEGQSGGRKEAGMQLETGAALLRLSKARRCVDAAPGLVMIQSDDQEYFWCVAVGTGESDKSAVPHFHSHLMESCSYKFVAGYQQAALEMGVVEDDPKILGVSSKQLAEGLARTTTSLAGGIQRGGRSLATSIRKRTTPMPESSKPQPEAKEAQVHPHIQGALETTSKVAGRIQTSLTWAVSSSFSLLGTGLEKTSEAMGHKKGRPVKSEPVRALSKMAVQSFNSMMDVYDALEDATAEVCASTAESTASIIRARHGQEAALATENAFKTTGSIIGAAMMYRMFRRPEDAPGADGLPSDCQAVVSLSAPKDVLPLPAIEMSEGASIAC